MNPIIHIGYPKTATSWFQKIFYPSVLNIDFINRNTIIEQLIQPNSLDFNPDISKDYFNKRFKNNIVLCDEILIGGLDISFGNGSFIFQSGLRLKKIFPDAQIIIFIRNQIDLIASAYYQYIKSGGNLRINKYLFPGSNSTYFIQTFNKFSFRLFEFDILTKFFKDLFGDNNVFVFPIEHFMEDNVKFLKSFIRDFKLEIDLTRLNYVEVNRRYRKGILKLAKFINLFYKGNTSNKYYILNIPSLYYTSLRLFEILNNYKLFGRIPSSVDILGPKNVNYIKEYYQNSNNNLITEHRINLTDNYHYSL